MTTIKKRQFLVFFFSLLTIIFLRIEYDRPGDQFIYLQASAELFLDKNIYSELYGNPAMLFYFGNPFLTTLLHPLTGIPMLFATTIWKTISIVCLLRISFVLSFEYIGAQQSLNVT